MAATPEQIQDKIAHFGMMKKNGYYSLLRSVEAQFIDMAQGGDGTAAMEGEIRNTYYPTWSTKNFQTVCDVMGWEYTRSKA